MILGPYPLLYASYSLYNQHLYGIIGTRQVDVMTRNDEGHFFGS